MQTNLAALFKGRKVEAPAPPPKRPVGRPRLPVGEMTLDEEIAAEVKAFKKRKQAETHEGIQELIIAKRSRGSEDPMPLPLPGGVADASMPLPLQDGGVQAAGVEEALPFMDSD